MTYPAPPWKLYGWVGLLVDWLPLERAKEALLPTGFLKTPWLSRRAKAKSVNQAVYKSRFSGTLGGHYVASYQSKEGVSFTEPFHEFGFLSCLAKFGNETGLHLARMAVDHPLALEGGKEVWGINKIPAVFEEIAPYGLQALSAENKLDVAVIFKKRIPLGRWSYPFTFINRAQGQPIKYQVTLKGKVSLCSVERKGFHHNGRLFPLLFEDCWITIDAPVEI
jgi:hypothetical protein